MFRVIVALATVVLAEGVKVALQVRPPSLLLTADNVPPITVRSALLKPATASLKVMVTFDVSPTFSAVSLRLMVAVGGTVSRTLTCTVAVVEVAPSPSLTVTETDRLAWPMPLPALPLS
ncbi:hypothetical protein D3C78_672970 [compost metagenome]